MTPRRTGALALGAAAALLGLAAPARADTYCVGVSNTTGCTTTSAPASDSARGTALQAVMTTALGHAGDDTIRLGPGRYDQAPALGAGVSATFNYGDSSTHSGTGRLTIKGDAPGVVLANSSTVLDDETVEGFDRTLPLTLQDLTIEGPPNAPQSLGIELSGSGSLLDRVTIQAPSGPVNSKALFAAIDARHNPVTIRNTVITGFHKALFTACRTVPAIGGTDFAGSATLQHVTIDVTGPMSSSDSTLNEKSVGGIDASCNHEPSRGTQTGAPTVTIEDSILTDAVTLREADGGAITLRRTRWKGTSAQESGTTVSQTNLTTATPGFVSTADLRLGATSPLIDLASGSTDPSTLDRDGAARTVDGDGNGSAISDLGAYEYQPGASPAPTPPASTPTPTPTPGSGGTPSPTPAPATPAITPAPTIAPTLAPLPTIAPGPGSPTPGPQTPLDETPALLSLRTSHPRVSKTGRLTIKVKCLTSERCRGRLRLLGAPGKSGKIPVLASANLSVKGGRTGKVVLTVRTSSRSALRRKGATLSLTYTPKGTKTIADTLTVKVARAVSASRRR